jgi:hypothetical protein
MTTVQTMFKRRALRGDRAAVAGSLVLLSGLVLGGCAGERDPLTPPKPLVAPYDATAGEALWAVAPLMNESGVSFVDSGKVADALVAAASEVRGVTCLPLNRTLITMRGRQLKGVSTPAEARALANALGVDGLIVGTITAYDPYDPPKIGLSLALWTRERSGLAGLDPMQLQSAFTDQDRRSRRSGFSPDRPSAVVSEHLDAANHEVQMSLRQYQLGRSDPGTALGWRSGLVNMDLYTNFAAHWAVSRLLEQERIRLGQDRAAAASDR